MTIENRLIRWAVAILTGVVFVVGEYAAYWLFPSKATAILPFFCGFGLPLIIVPVLVYVVLTPHVKLPIPGHCPHCHCGYNLTGNVSGVCPECGTAVVKDKP